MATSDPVERKSKDPVEEVCNDALKDERTGSMGGNSVKHFIGKTHLGETYETIQAPPTGAAQPLDIGSINHISFDTKEIQKATDFYVKVLGFEKLRRPSFKFDGAWLRRGSTIIHIIESDPEFESSKEKIREAVAENMHDPRFIRRGRHMAFEVPDVLEAEKRLLEHGILYTKFTIPDGGGLQIFFTDPDGNGIEVGNYPSYDA